MILIVFPTFVVTVFSGAILSWQWPPAGSPATSDDINKILRLKHGISLYIIAKNPNY